MPLKWLHPIKYVITYRIVDLTLTHVRFLNKMFSLTGIIIRSGIRSYGCVSQGLAPSSAVALVHPGVLTHQQEKMCDWVRQVPFLLCCLCQHQKIGRGRHEKGNFMFYHLNIDETKDDNDTYKRNNFSSKVCLFVTLAVDSSQVCLGLKMISLEAKKHVFFGQTCRCEKDRFTNICALRTNHVYSKRRWRLRTCTCWAWEKAVKCPRHLKTQWGNCKHNQNTNDECGVCLFKIVTLLEEEFSKLKNLQDGWMFYKSTGIYNLHVKYT